MLMSSIVIHLLSDRSVTHFKNKSFSLGFAQSGYAAFLILPRCSKNHNSCVFWHSSRF